MMAQLVKNSLAMQEISCNAGYLGSNLGSEDPLKKDMETHFNILAWEILWTEDPGSLQSMVSQEMKMT